MIANTKELFVGGNEDLMANKSKKNNFIKIMSYMIERFN